VDWEQWTALYGEGEVSFSLAKDTSHVASSFRSIKTAWLNKVRSKRQKNSEESKEANKTSSLASDSDEETDRARRRKTRSMCIKETTDRTAESPAAKPEKKRLPLKAIMELTHSEVEDMFDIAFEEKRGIPEHLRESNYPRHDLFKKSD
jgi:hypothetical protein